MKANSAGITVSTPNPSDAKTYPIEVTANPPFGYDPVTSNIKVKFNIVVKCEPRKISAASGKDSYSFSIGSYTPLTITYESFSVTPACMGAIALYDVSLSNG